MSHPAVLAVFGVLFLAMGGFMVYAHALNLWAGLSLLGVALSILGMAKCAGHGAEPSAGALRKFGAFCLFLSAIACLGLFLWQFGLFSKRADDGRPELNIDKFEIARAHVFAMKVLELHARSSALVLAGSAPGCDALVKAQIEEMKKVFGSSIDIAAVESFPVEFRKDSGRWVLPKSVDVKSFEAAILKHKDCKLVVSMVGLPFEMWKMTIWKWNDLARPSVALLDGNPRWLGKSIAAGHISVVASYRPGWTYFPEVPSDPVKAFSMRYLLVTKDNVAEIAERFRNVQW